MRKEVAEMTVDEPRISVDTEDEESSSVSPVKTMSSVHLKENSPFIYPSSAITDVICLNFHYYLFCQLIIFIFNIYHFHRLMN